VVGCLLLGPGSAGAPMGMLVFVVVATAAAIALRRLGHVDGRGIHTARVGLRIRRRRRRGVGNRCEGR